MEIPEGLPDRIREMLVKRLRLKMSPSDIGAEQPLFGDEGLGLDSIDVLEVVAGLEKEFGVTVQSQEEGEKVLRNLNTIAEFLAAKGVS